MNVSRKLQIAVLGVLIPVLYLYPSEEGKDAVKAFEGYSEVSYKDGANVSTICWGSTRGVTPSAVSTPEDCELRLTSDLESVNRDIKRLVKHDLTQGQYDALVSFVFNLGGAKFSSSTLLKRINSGNCTAATGEFLRWVYVSGKVSRGLQRRRALESKLFGEGCQVWDS